VDTGFNREPGGTLNSVTTGGKAYFYLTDALGSVVALTDESGTKVNTYSYSPRGVTRAATSEQVSQPYRFAAGYQDPTGLYHFQARYYDTNIGRFTQPDPSGQEQNPYLYAEGDPVNRIDPSGELSIGDAFDSVGKAFDAYDVGEIAANIGKGDWVAAARGIGSFTAGFVVGAACTAASSGTGFTAAAGCLYAGYASGEIVGSVLSP
jgi:RHS repeat-associated protein